MKTSDRLQEIEEKITLMSEEIEHVKDCIILTGSNVEVILDRINTISPVRYDDMFNSMNHEIEKSVKNMERFDIGVKELRGLLDTARSIIRERKDTTPRWYDIDQTPPPKSGEIWVRDIDGQETIAVCLNHAIVYPMQSSTKLPKFWKPV